jgi:hypothetical protein
VIFLPYDLSSALEKQNSMEGTGCSREDAEKVALNGAALRAQSGALASPQAGAPRLRVAERSVKNGLQLVLFAQNRSASDEAHRQPNELAPCRIRFENGVSAIAPAYTVRYRAQIL